MFNRQSLLSHYQSLFKSSQPIKIEINIIDFLSQNPSQHQTFSKNPSNYLQELQKQIINKKQAKQLNDIIKKLTARIKFTSIPYTRSIYKQLPDVTVEDVNNWVILSGTIVQCTPRRTLQKSKLFACEECGYQQRLENSYLNYYRFQNIQNCPNRVKKPMSMFMKFNQNLQQRKSKSTERAEYEGKCKSTKAAPKDNGKICLDYQQMRVQEQFKHISAGKIPHTIMVLVENQTDVPLRAGDDVTISGIIGYRYKKPVKDIKMQCQLVLLANSVVSHTAIKNTLISSKEDSLYTDYPLHIYKDYNLTSEQTILAKQLQFRNDVLRKFCPTIYGRSTIKLGLILAYLGGVSFENENTKVRGQSHVLLVGEPGTGKSMLLKEIAALGDRSFMTNGIGTSSAGLSVSYYKDGNDWTIEPGALVLADNGICCIDQFNLLARKDQTALLQAMQQQTISSAKASVVGKLNARTTVICACNPITSNQMYDDTLDIQHNTGLGTPLLSRFDLILILRDEKDKNQDAEKCQFVLSKFCAGGETEQTESDTFSLKNLLKKCKVYQPNIEGAEILSKYYAEQRKRDQKNTTARMFQSLCRLTEAHAKLMMRDSTTQLDYITAIMLSQNRHATTLEEYYAFLDEFNVKYNTNLT